MCYVNPKIINRNLLTNQIAGFFDRQYLWNKAGNALAFLHTDSTYQGKITSKTTTMIGSGQACPATRRFVLTF